MRMNRASKKHYFDSKTYLVSKSDTKLKSASDDL